MTIDDRIAGALLGVHVGDALGASAEFMSPAQVLEHFPLGVYEITGGGAFDWAPGAATDDTSLTKAVLDAYARRDLTAALAVWRGDEEIDAVCNSVLRELLTYMMEDPRNITFCIHLLFCAKNIERMGDHATNIAETVHYIIEGQPIADQRPKGDTTNIAAIGSSG